jgi:hypothetical protein
MDIEQMANQSLNRLLNGINKDLLNEFNELKLKNENNILKIELLKYENASLKNELLNWKDKYNLLNPLT